MASPLIPILSATLEADDMALAEAWLAKPESEWQERGLVTQWEHQFAAYLGADTAIAYLGGRASLYAAIRALDLRPGDEVIVPAFTCQCVINALRYQGVEPCYTDIELDTYGLDVQAVAQQLSEKTRAILLQYTFGLVSRDIEALLMLAHRHQLYVIEDCAHALGARWKGRKLGTLGDVAIFSTERSKIINTIHGGLVTTCDPAIGQRLRTQAVLAPLPSVMKTRQLLNTVIHHYLVYGSPDRQVTAVQAEQKWGGQILPQMFAPEFKGEFTAHYTERLNAPIAALALNQFQKMAPFHSRRLQAAHYWNQWSQKQGYKPPLVIPDSEPTFLRYPLCVSEEQKQNAHLLEQMLQVTVGVWFTSAAHPLPLLLEHCPNGTYAAKTCINLPTLLPNCWIDKLSTDLP